MSEPRDLQHEGKSDAYLDVDRMTNEGLAGGRDHIAYGKRQIEESQDIHKEAPPYSAEKED
ncbi:hypothetical protein [Alteribacter natronophilus]|uniref:hypothetical protein n=1 Tax=Alteribacter natronophilus TaxID=2583810 RepID=UPI00110DA033|nr:hypothetical protein [Alteribacter natronophilus]TMW74033.1 hypothetical protein FGB90_07140 [Alteribacter natronophilus]